MREGSHAKYTAAGFVRECFHAEDSAAGLVRERLIPGHLRKGVGFRDLFSAVRGGWGAPDLIRNASAKASTRKIAPQDECAKAPTRSIPLQDSCANASTRGIAPQDRCAKAKFQDIPAKE